MSGHSGHLRELELAGVGREAHDARQSDHLRWCRQCSSAVVEYRWLEDDLGTMLALVAGQVAVPSTGWPRTRAGLNLRRRREMTARRFYAVLACLCAGLLILLAAPLGGVSMAAPDPGPQAMCIPVPSPRPGDTVRLSVPARPATPSPDVLQIDLRPVPEPASAPHTLEPAGHTP